ncbi:MAG TPA: MarR family transcriptional regulator [Candidatus Limnocylindrales bacterium]|nr:MarR family transcriptional regulator [Candidatus Limnocylindrales bacterium]
MSSPEQVDRAGRIADLARAVREAVGQATLLGYAAGRSLSLSQVDLETLDLLRREGRQTAGRLAEATGLTTSAATRQIDRLEAAGYVRRTTDPADRRRAVVAPVPERIGPQDPLIPGLAESLARRLDGYDAAKLDVAQDAVQRVVAALGDEAARWRSPDAPLPTATTEGGESSAPLAGATHGRLVFPTGSPPLTISAGSRTDLLYEARFVGGTPRVRVRVRLARTVLLEAGHGSGLPRVDVRSGVVTFRFPGLPFLRQGGRGTVRLNPAIPWSISVSGGLSQLEADLRGLAIERIQIAGGANRGRLTLGPARGAVQILIAGGANDLTIRRPAGTGVEVEAGGGITKLTLDGRQVEAGQHRLVAVDEGGGDRYEISVSGGANRVAVETSRD